MNRKSLILLALPAFLLGGCNKEISAADAKQKAKEIEEHEVDTSALEAVTMDAHQKMDISGTYNGTAMSVSTDISYTYEISAKDKFLHIVVPSVKGSYTETWEYIKDGKFVIAVRQVAGETESKYYAEVEDIGGTGTKQFEEALKSTVTSLAEVAKNKEGLAIVEEAAEAEEKPVEGVEFSVKYYTAGDGNLTIEGTASFKDYEVEGLKGDASFTVKYGWDKYLMSNYEVNMSMNIVEESSSTNMAVKMEQKGSLKFECSSKLPDLSGFEKKSIN